MKKLAKLGLVLSLFAASVMPAFAQNDVETASAATLWKGTATGYTKASDVKYNTSGKYIANWGARDEVCTFLTSYATDFYTGSYTYEQLSLNAGSTNTASVPSSALYKALNTLVKSKQTSTTSYDATREMYRYTDCVNGNYSYISSFYSAAKLNGDWDSGKTWNREHTWPNSKGDANGSGENDIMMLRPTATSENGSRGNKAYGESTGFYDPNCEGQNVRGDCARIILYVYTRWGTANMWNSGGVMESKDILLKWMEEDPVDTWEMGRNDVTEDIVGTRNVYVDYPELAWQLFGQTAPTDLVTPSGKASNGTATPTPTPTPDPTPDPEPEIPTNPTTQKEIVAAAYALSSGETLGQYTLTGEITNVKQYDSSTTNICLTITVEGKAFYCYWMRDNANGDNASLAVGDTITVTGTIKNYNGTVEFDKPTLGTVVKEGSGSNTPVEPDTPVEPEQPDTPVIPDPDIPVEPDPDTPVTPDPDTPVEPDPDTPVNPDPDTPVEPDPDTPVNPDPDTPVEPDPDTPDAPEVGGEECNHEYGEWFVIMPATEETEGLQCRFCENCGEMEEQTIAKLTQEPSSDDTDSTVDGDETDSTADGKQDMLGNLTAGCQASIGASLVGMVLLTAGFVVLKRKENE